MVKKIESAADPPKSKYEFVREGFRGLPLSRAYAALRALGEWRYSGKDAFGVYSPDGAPSVSFTAELRWPYSDDWRELIALSTSGVLRITLSNDGPRSKKSKETLEPEADRIKRWLSNYLRKQ